ncbi:hypothetical protein [Rhizobium sp. 21-4511-3d]
MGKASEVRYTNVKITDKCLVRKQGAEWRVEPVGNSGYRLIEQRTDGRIHDVPKSIMMRDIALGIVAVDPLYFEDDAIKARNFELDRDLDPADMSLDTRRRVRAVTAFVDGMRRGKWKRSRPHAIEFLKQFAEEEGKIEQARVSGGKARGGVAIDRDIQLASDKVMVDWCQFLRLVRKYLAHGCSPSTLVSGNRGSIKGTRIKFDTQSFIRMKYLSGQQPSAVAILADIQSENLRRKNAGMDRFLEEPDKRTIQRFVKGIRDLEAKAGRHGSKTARLEFALSYGGPTADYPLQRVEMDEKLLDLEAFLTDTGLIKVIHPVALARLIEMGRAEVRDDKRKRKKNDRIKRLWLSVAFDVATRSVLGMKLLRTEQPTARDAIEVLEMAVNSKAHITDYLKTETEWPMMGKPEWVYGDHGAYATFEFQDCVTALTGNVVNPPTDHPNLRGAIERFFKTLDDRYMHMFPGRTFGNPIARGDADPKALAALTDVELAECLVRLIVDCYHNTAHSGLADLSPLEAWYFLNDGHDVALVPERVQRRAFAVTLKDRKITNDGLVVMGLPYGDERLQELRNQTKDGSFTIRVSGRSLKHIWVRKVDDDGYFKLECNLPGVDANMTFYEWRAALLHLTAENKKKLVGNWEKAKAARLEVQKMVTDAQNKAGITIAPFTADAVHDVETETVKGVVFRSQSTPDYGEETLERQNPGNGRRNTPTESVKPASFEDLDAKYGAPDDGIHRDPNRFLEQPEASERRESRTLGKLKSSESAPSPEELPPSMPGPTRTRIGRPTDVWNDDED